MKVNDLYQQYFDIRLNLQIMIMRMILVVLIVVAAFKVICKIVGYSPPSFFIVLLFFFYIGLYNTVETNFCR